jgi:ABC-type glycerol-3-phosphate transport system substrate-binding protein
MRVRTILLAGALTLAPVAAGAADLVVWWEKGYRPEEDRAFEEIVAAFEQKTGKTVDVSFHIQWELPDKLTAALKADQPPDITFGFWLDTYVPRWALEDRLVDLSEPLASLTDLFDPSQLARAELLNASLKGSASQPPGKTASWPP